MKQRTGTLKLQGDLVTGEEKDEQIQLCGAVFVKCKVARTAHSLS